MDNRPQTIRKIAADLRKTITIARAEILKIAAEYEHCKDFCDEMHRYGTWLSHINNSLGMIAKWSGRPNSGLAQIFAVKKTETKEIADLLLELAHINRKNKQVAVQLRGLCNRLNETQRAFSRILNIFDGLNTYELQPCKGGQRVYVMEFEDGAVKIGVTCNIRQRIYAVQSDWGCQVVKIARTYGLNDAFFLEKIMHRYFAACRITDTWHREYFDVDFKKAINFLKRFVSEIYFDERKNGG